MHVALLGPVTVSSDDGVPVTARVGGDGYQHAYAHGARLSRPDALHLLAETIDAR